MSQNQDKKTAIKLINKYAERYSILEEENKLLKVEIGNLRVNLRINKDIIEGLYSGNNKSKDGLYIQKLKEENSKLTFSLNKANKDNNDLRSKVMYSEQLCSDNITKEKNEIEKLKTKMFVLENVILKKDNIIESLKKRYEKQIETESNLQSKENVVVKEIYLSNPSDAVNRVHDELMLYKQLYVKMGEQIMYAKKSLLKYESLNNDLRNQNIKLAKEIQNKSIDEATTKKDSTTTIRNMKSDNHFNSYTTAAAGKNLTKLSELNKDSDLNKSNFTANLIIDKPQEEWTDVLKNCGINNEEYIRYTKAKAFSKVIDIVEFLYKLLLDKNMQIKILNEEYTQVSNINSNLNHNNVSLNQQYHFLKSKISEKINPRLIKGDTGMDNSMINNTSQIITGKGNNYLKNSSSIDIYANYECNRGGANTLESITSSEFRHGISNNDSCYIDDNSGILENLAVKINNTNI